MAQHVTLTGLRVQGLGFKVSDPLNTSQQASCYGRSEVRMHQTHPNRCRVIAACFRGRPGLENAETRPKHAGCRKERKEKSGEA